MYTMVYESTIRKNETTPRSGIGKKVEMIIASEVRETLRGQFSQKGRASPKGTVLSGEGSQPQADSSSRRGP